MLFFRKRTFAYQESRLRLLIRMVSNAKYSVDETCVVKSRHSDTNEQGSKFNWMAETQENLSLVPTQLY